MRERVSFADEGIVAPLKVESQKSKGEGLASATDELAQTTITK